jgi:hypothetical protein
MMQSQNQYVQAHWRLLIWMLMFFMFVAAAAAQTSIFQIQNSPSPNGAGNTLNAVAATSSTDAWAVGFQNGNNLNQARTLTLHFDGTRWKTVASPNPGRCNIGNFGNVLNSVAAISRNDVWAVGFTFPCNALQRTMAMHFDGIQWTVVPTPKLPTTNNNALNGVIALASNNVFAVGFQAGANGATITLIEHWDGTSWKIVSSPNFNNTGNVLSSISATSASDIWAVGNAVAPNVPIVTLVEHFDGTSWKIVPSPNPLTGSSDQNVLTSVTAVSPVDATAAGFTLDIGNQRELTMVQHWDGKSWTVVPSPNVDSNPGSFNTLHSVSAFSSTNIYAVGFFANGTTAGNQETLLEHFDGTSWTILPSPTKGLAQQLNGVFALPGSSNIWGVGAFSINGTQPETGLLIIPKSLVLFSLIG